MGQDPSTIRAEIEQTRGRMGDTVDALAYKADVKGRARDSVSEKVESVKSRFTGTASRAGAAGPSGEDIRGGARRAAGMAQENPLGLALGAVAVGFVGGLLVPATRVENEKIGPVADELKDQVRETAQVAVDHGRQAAQEAAQAATEAVKETGSEHAQQAKDDMARQAQQAQERVRSA